MEKSLFQEFELIEFFKQLKKFMRAEEEIAFEACEKRQIQKLQTVVPQIVDCNAKISIWNKNGIKMENATLLHVAAFSGAYECVKFLIKYGADLSPLDKKSISIKLFQIY